MGLGEGEGDVDGCVVGGVEDGDWLVVEVCLVM